MQEPARPVRAARTTLVGRPPLGRMLALLRRQGRRRHDDDRDQHRDRAPSRARPEGRPRRRQPPVRRPPGVPRPRPRPQVDRRRRDRAAIDADLVRQVLVKHDSGVDLLLAPAVARGRGARRRRSTCRAILDQLRGALRLHPRSTSTSASTTSTSASSTAADTIFVVMTADLSCLKNVRLVLETIGQLGYEPEQGPARPQPLERVHRHQRQERRGRAEADDRPPDRQRVPRRDQRPEQRRAVHVHEGGLAAGAIAARLRARSSTRSRSPRAGTAAARSRW